MDNFYYLVSHIFIFAADEMMKYLKKKTFICVCLAVFRQIGCESFPICVLRVSFIPRQSRHVFNSIYFSQNSKQTTQKCSLLSLSHFPLSNLRLCLQREMNGRSALSQRAESSLDAAPAVVAVLAPAAAPHRVDLPDVVLCVK